jgi:hypothetical protein
MSDAKGNVNDTNRLAAKSGLAEGYWRHWEAQQVGIPMERALEDHRVSEMVRDRQSVIAITSQVSRQLNR